MKRTRMIFRLFCATALLLGLGSRASAEVHEVNLAQQFGIGSLTFMVMQDQKLIEKQAAAAGLGDVKVNWIRFPGGAAMNDAVISGDLQFALGGVAPFATLWSKTRSNLGVKAVYAVNSMPMLLNTRNPEVKTLKDFTDKDKIALPGVKVSIQAVILQMAAEQAFGAGHENRLDRLTVTRSHADGMAALLSNASEIDSHFTSPPYSYEELEHAGIHTVLNSYDVLGGPHNLNVIYTTSKFRAANPNIYAACLRAFEQATVFIENNKKAAAEIYLRVSKDKLPLEAVLKILNNPQVQYTLTPQGTMKIVDFMYGSGALKVKPTSWQEMYMPEAHKLPGN